MFKYTLARQVEVFMSRISFLESKIAPCEEEAAQAKKQFMLFIVIIIIVSVLGYLLLVHSGSGKLTRLAQWRQLRKKKIKIYTSRH
jgi:hypothetical protein